MQFERLVSCTETARLHRDRACQKLFDSVRGSGTGHGTEIMLSKTPGPKAETMAPPICSWIPKKAANGDIDQSWVAAFWKEFKLGLHPGTQEDSCGAKREQTLLWREQMLRCSTIVRRIPHSIMENESCSKWPTSRCDCGRI